jgi:hypothetical protein
MRGWSRQAMVIPLVGLILFGCTIATAEAQQSSLPANWQQLSPTDFATLVRGYYQQGTFQSLSASDQLSLATQGALFFSQVDFSNTTLSYQTLLPLFSVGQTQLDQWTVAQAQTGLIARTENWTGKPYTEMRAKIMLMRRLQVPAPISLQQARNWVLAGGTADQVPQNDLVYDFVRQMFADFQVINGSFSVTWTGQLNVPQTGAYTFSISPIDVNMGFNSPPANVAMTVALGGQPTISAKPPNPPDPLSLLGAQSAPVPTSNWVAQSNPVTLTAGTPINVQVSVSVTGPSNLPIGSLHAMLYWQGPGIATSLVPASAFSQAQTGAAGLQATYTWTANGQTQALTRGEPMIDTAWTNSSIILPQDPTSANQSAATMWQALTSSTFISSLSDPDPRCDAQSVYLWRSDQ